VRKVEESQKTTWAMWMVEGALGVRRLLLLPIMRVVREMGMVLW
jgi:hypothetical protein